MARLLVLVLLLTGCETLLPHTKVSDESVIANAKFMYQLQDCAQRGLISQELLTPYSLAVTQYMHAVVLNRKLYEDTYAAGAPRVPTSECPEVTPHLARMTANVRRQTQEALAWQSSGGSRSSRTVQTVQVDFPINQPKGEVNLTGNQSGTKHYLINTGSGTKQCHVTSSGYTFCN